MPLFVSSDVLLMSTTKPSKYKMYHYIVKSSFMSTSKELEVKYIPNDAHNRLPIDISSPQPWGNKRQPPCGSPLQPERGVSTLKCPRHKADVTTYRSATDQSSGENF